MRTDRQTDMTKLIGAFHNFANLPKKKERSPWTPMRKQEQIVNWI